ncbi:MAG: hypothetical protein LH472_02665 [Pyrinomonadaceae bacterium]|nr:hypothetical protein [Pyrinomonadaceae bacterium]
MSQVRRLSKSSPKSSICAFWLALKPAVNATAKPGGAALNQETPAVDDGVFANADEYSTSFRPDYSISPKSPQAKLSPNRAVSHDYPANLSLRSFEVSQKNLYYFSHEAAYLLLISSLINENCNICYLGLVFIRKPCCSRLLFILKTKKMTVLGKVFSASWHLCDLALNI